MKRSPEIAQDDASWCMQHGIAVYQVGDVYDTDADGEPITEADREKWFVSILVGSFPEDARTRMHHRQIERAGSLPMLEPQPETVGSEQL